MSGRIFDPLRHDLAYQVRLREKRELLPFGAFAVHLFCAAKAMLTNQDSRIITPEKLHAADRLVVRRTTRRIRDKLGLNYGGHCLPVTSRLSC
jgi:hypothetical protein